MELEITRLVQIIKCIYYIVKIVKYITIIFINYIVNTAIIRQMILLISSTDNWVFIYLLQFNIKIKYRFNKYYIIFNISSYLSLGNNLIKNNLNNILDLNNYYIGTIDLSYANNVYAI